MKAGIETGRKNLAAIYLAFFTIGLLEDSFPLLSRHLIYFFHVEYYVRLLSFLGLLLLSSLSIVFSKARQDKNFKMWFALLILVAGMILDLLGVKSTGFLFVKAFLLFAGSLFVQISGLLLLLPTAGKPVEHGKIALIYLFNSAGLVVGMSLVSLSTFSGVTYNQLLAYTSFFFLALTMGTLFFFPDHSDAEPESHDGIRPGPGKIFSNKTLILMLGGLAVYTGAEFCLTGMLPFYFSETFGIRIIQMIIPGAGLFILSFFTGRIAGVLFLRKISADNIFLFSGLLAILGVSAFFIGQKSISLAATVMTGLGIANMLPLMISLSLENISADRKWLVGMIAGTMPMGAFIPTLMWAMADSISVGMCITIPVICLFYISWIGIILKRKI